MAQIITINQIHDLFHSWTKSHLFLQDFGFGQTSEIGVSRQLRFPYLWCTLGPGTQIGALNKTAIPVLNLIVIIADQTNIQETGDNFNVLENMSDCFQIAQDLVTTIQVEWNKYGIIINDTPTLEPVIDETQDSVNGWALNLNLKLIHQNCAIPVKL